MTRFQGTPVEEGAAKKPRFGGTPAALPAATDANLKALSDLTQNPRNVVDPAYERKLYEDAPGGIQTITSILDMINAGGRMMGLTDKAAAAVRAPFTDKTYDQELEATRTETERARARHPWMFPAVEIGSQLLLPTKAVGLPAAIGEGALYGAASAFGEDTDATTGMAVGAGGGAAGNILGRLIAAGGNKLGQVWQDYLAEPTELARQKLYVLAQQAGIGSDEIAEAVVRYGPETMPIDVLGQTGRRAARTVSNVSPEGQETMTTALQGRKQGQNPRLVADVQRAANVPVGDRRTVQDIIDSSYAARRPAIDAAYDAARAAGAELPREPFLQILETPMGRQAYEASLPSLANRKAIEGPEGGVAGALARLDQTKIELDSIAAVARRQGDNNRAAQAEALSTLLRNRIDETLASPEYAAARAARKAAYDEQRAIELGQGAAAQPDIGMPAAITGVDPSNMPALRSGYASQTADDLLSGTQSATALNRMSTPMATETRAAVLGDQAPTIENALARERLFNQSEKAVSGNSSSIQQLIDVAGGAGGAAALGYMTDWSPAAIMAGGLPGLFRAASKFPAVQRALTPQNREAAMSELGRLLTSGADAIPTERPLPAPISEAVTTPLPDWLKRLGIVGGVANQEEFSDPATADPAGPVPVEPAGSPPPQEPAGDQQGMLDMPVPVGDPLEQPALAAATVLPSLMLGLTRRSTRV